MIIMCRECLVFSKKKNKSSTGSYETKSIENINLKELIKNIIKHITLYLIMLIQNFFAGQVNFSYSLVGKHSSSSLLNKPQ